MYRFQMPLTFEQAIPLLVNYLTGCRTCEFKHIHSSLPTKILWDTNTEHGKTNRKSQTSTNKKDIHDPLGEVKRNRITPLEGGRWRGQKIGAFEIGKAP